jgi:hypothetical protein
MTLTGCQTVKEATIAGTAASVGAGIAAVSTGGILAPMGGALVGGASGTVLANLTKSSSGTGSDLHRESIFLLAEKVVRVAGWWLVLLFLAPWLLGWAMPSPMAFKKLNGKGHE